MADSKERQKKGKLERCYGYFKCEDCKKKWESSHTYCTRTLTELDPKTPYGQQCKNCVSDYFRPYRVEELKCSQCKQPKSNCKCVQRKLLCSCCHEVPKSCKCKKRNFLCSICQGAESYCRCGKDQYTCRGCRKVAKSCTCEKQELLCKICHQREGSCECELVKILCSCCKQVAKFCECGSREYRCNLCGREDMACECPQPSRINWRIPHKIEYCEKCESGFPCV